MSNPFVSSFITFESLTLFPFNYLYILLVMEKHHKVASRCLALLLCPSLRCLQSPYVVDDGFVCVEDAGGVRAPLEGMVPSIPPQPPWPCRDPSVGNHSTSEPFQVWKALGGHFVWRLSGEAAGIGLSGEGTVWQPSPALFPTCTTPLWFCLAWQVGGSSKARGLGKRGSSALSERFGVMDTRVPFRHGFGSPYKCGLLSSTSAPPSRPLMELLGLGGHHWFWSRSQHPEQVPHHTRKTFHLLTSTAALPNHPTGASAALLLKALRPEACPEGQGRHLACCWWPVDQVG